MTRIKLIEKEDASDEVRAVYKDIEAAFGMVPNLFKNILEYARKATLTPHKITDAETDELRSFGLTDSQIVEVLGVMELFTGYNKFLDSLAVPLAEIIN